MASDDILPLLRHEACEDTFRRTRRGTPDVLNHLVDNTRLATLQAFFRILSSVPDTSFLRGGLKGNPVRPCQTRAMPELYPQL